MRAAATLVVGALWLGLAGCGGDADSEWTPTAAPTARASVEPEQPALYAAPDGREDARGTKADPLTIDSAITRAKAGSVIGLSAGEYPPVSVTRAFDDTVTIAGPPARGRIRDDPPAARIAGGGLSGAAGLTFDRVAFTAQLQIGSRGEDASERLRFQRSEFTSPESNCLSIRGGTRDLHVTRSWVHDCQIGVNGPASPREPRSTRLRFTSNILSTFEADAVLFGSWDDVVFDRNLMEEARDPEGTNHNDVFQFLGFSDRVRVTRNVLRHSDDQLMLIQPAIGPITRTLVAGNVMYGSGRFGVQSWAGDLRFVNNTVWDTGSDAVLLRGGGGNVAGDSVIVNNILSGLQFYDGGRARVVRNNLVSKLIGTDLGQNRLVRDPGFVDVRRRDYRLRRGSPGLGRALSGYGWPGGPPRRGRAWQGNIGALG